MRTALSLSGTPGVARTYTSKTAAATDPHLWMFGFLNPPCS